MFASNVSRLVAFVFTGMAIALLTAGVAVAQNRARAKPDAIGLSRTFLRDVYPELASQELLMKVSASGPLDEDWRFGNAFTVQLWKVAPSREAWTKGPDGKPKRIEDELLFGASFWIDRHGQLYRVTAGGPSITHEGKNQELRKLIDAHQEWADEQVVQALTESGARFGPNRKSEFRKIVPLDKLEKFLGKLTVESIDFKLRDQQDEQSIAELYWVVRAQASRPGKPAYRYSLFFEPFAGRLYHIYGSLKRDGSLP